MTSRYLMLLPLVWLLFSCSGSQSALDVHGDSAFHIKNLMIGIIIVSTMIWTSVVVVLIIGLRRRVTAELSSSKQPLFIVAGAVIATALVVMGLTIVSFYTTNAISRQEHDVIIKVSGQQWWWRIQYLNPNPKLEFETANEIHVPVGRNITLVLEGADVIHSFWVPSLAGKQDLVPGRTNTLSFRVERPGVYRGQCAEFCGLQHSHMAVLVIAEDEPNYQRWLAHQRSERIDIVNSEASAGEKVFLRKPCAACHRIRGTSALGVTGPDLTHIGSRETISAGLLPRTRGSLAAWIADPQTLKPGNNMPMVQLTSDELRQLSLYLDSLK